MRWVRRELAIRPGNEADDEAAVWRELDFVAELLDGRSTCAVNALAPLT